MVSKMAITLLSSGNILLAKYIFGKLSLHINIWYMHPFWKIAYICNPLPFSLYVIFFMSALWPLKLLVISYMDHATTSIQISGNINSINIRRSCTLQFGFVLVEVWSGGFVKQRMPWSSCDGGLDLTQINSKWIHFHVPCTLAVAWI